MTNRTRIGVLFVFASAALLFSGCSVFDAGHHEPKAMAGRMKTAVLIRVTTANPRGQAKPEPVEAEVWDLQAKQRIPVQIQSFSRESRKQGWCGFLVPPGSYFVQLVPRDRSYVRKGGSVPPLYSSFGRRHDIQLTPPGQAPPNVDWPAYYLSVPAGPGAVYAGSFGFSRGKEHFSHPSGITVNRTWLEPREVQDETEAAKAVGSQTWADAGPLMSSIMVSYDDLDRTLRGFSPSRKVAIMAGSSVDFSGPTGYGKAPAAVAAAPFFGAGYFLTEVALSDSDDEDSGLFEDSGSDKSNLGMAATGFALMAAAVPIYWTIDKLFGEPSRKRWERLNAGIHKEVSEFDLNRQLAESVSKQLSDAVTVDESDTNNASPFVLRLQIYRQGLRSMRAMYGLEVAVRLELVDRESGRVIWENCLVHSDRTAAALNNRDFLDAPYETLIPSSSDSFPLKVFRGKAGARRFHVQLETATSGLSEAIVQRCRQAGF